MRMNTRGTDMTKNEFTLLYAIKKNGMQSRRRLSELTGLSLGYVSQQLNKMQAKNWTDENGITEAGLSALAPYKVDNAVIMAAGLSSRFVPLSLEKPKGLLIVKNEVLIEREIEQLHEAGIRDIVLILGYKKEAFFYLESKYEGVKIVINPAYNVKNNTYTLYCAKDYIRNSYICSSDNYFAVNPFTDYVYRSYYSAIHVTKKTNEWYMMPDAKGNIAKVQIGGKEGDIMLGHVYWDHAFSEAMLSILEADQSVGAYDQALWERILMENVKKLPPMEIKLYPKDTIFEFDSLDELRTFDRYYVNDTHSRIMKNIASVLGCEQKDVLHFRAIKEGITNTSFVFEAKGKKYVYRHPGEGTEAIISRRHEKKALELARAVGADPTFLYMNGEEGWKLSSFVEGIRIPDYASFEDSLRVISVMRQLHDKNLSVDWSFDPWEEACRIETILREEKGGIADREFDVLKASVKSCYDRCKGDGVTPRFCHCDTYASNWMLTKDGKTILIDWEYAGNADPGCDVGSYIMDSMWQPDEAERFIRAYCGDAYNETLRFHYLAYTAILSYHWYVWALYREACGVVMGDSLYNWHVMAKRYANCLNDPSGE